MTALTTSDASSEASAGDNCGVGGGAGDGLGDMEFRDAMPDDAVAIAEVHVASWRVAYRHLLPDALLDGLSVEGRGRWWRRLLDAPRGDRVTLAVRDGVVVGFVHVALGPPDAPDCGELVTLYLTPETWGTGVGQRLHDTSLVHLGAAGCTEARVWMLSTNERARRFYVRQGWTRLEEVRIQQFATATVIDHRFAIDLRRSDGSGLDLQTGDASAISSSGVQRI